jgi:hypothetical protein
VTTFRKNSLRIEMLNRFGQTAGCPLFDETSKSLSDADKALLQNAPKAIPTGIETKRLAYIKLLHDQRRLSDMEKLAWEAFAQLGPASNMEIAKHLGKESGWVSARNNALRELGILTSDVKRKCRVTGEVVQTWRVK